ncbi:MAG: ATP-binding protein [Ignavibacteriaceae bacterium]
MAIKKSTEDFNNLSQEILGQVNRDASRIDFLHDILKRLLRFSGCEAVEIMIKKHDKYASYKITQHDESSVQYSAFSFINNEREAKNKFQKQSPIEQLQIDIIERRFDKSLLNFKVNGSFWTGDVDKETNLKSALEKEDRNYSQKSRIGCKSLAFVPLFFSDDIIGCILLISKQREYFNEDDIRQYEGLSNNLGISLVNQRDQAALRERVKELTCLYSIAKVSEGQDSSINDILKGIVESIPPAWQYPEVAMSRISINGNVFSTPGFQQTGQKQSADIILNGKKRGFVEVVYTEEKPKLDEGPFLREERNLIDAIARQIALIVEQKETEENRLKLQDQIRHADRLATIGQLAAGVAHELNEPLGSILGFAQLIKKCQELPESASKDVDAIVDASLNAREVIKKLLLFAREAPSQKEKVNLNKTIIDGLYFFEARCTKEGIELVRLLSPDLPEIYGDRTQLNQVLVNLVVNGIQAMPQGGKLTIKTNAVNNKVILVVEDTGIGMRDDVIKKIFIPFFTTKDINEGTGLGLSVVHGIISAHKGEIRVQSSVNKGTRFEIKLPITQN